MSLAVPSSPSPAGPRPLQLVDGNLQSPAVSTCPSPTPSGLSTPPPSAHKFHPRRQSSISYYPSDHSPSWDIRSPTTASRPSSLRRSTSLNQRAPARLDLKGDRRSLPLSEVVDSPQAERPPLTLTEKHADLLRFIAQKESKCLELRSQLAAHEAELAQLKRKWERIVSRGMDRAYSQQPGTPTGASSNSLLSGAVKDVSRLLVAGLGDLSASPTPSAATPPLAGARHDHPPRTPALALKTSSRVNGHANTQSTSSSGTSSAPMTAASSVRLSQSSASSLAFDEPPHEEDEHPAQPSSSSPPSSFRRTSVRVDGGTGIESPVQISPASALAAAKLHRRKSREVPPLPPSPSPLSAPPTSSSAAEDEPARRKRASVHGAVSGGERREMPPAASIPGLGPLASPLASSWMESVGSSVGKKWGELQKGETFTKSQKRASLLIFDAASSLFAALSPANAPATSSSSRSFSSSAISVSANPFGASIAPLGASPTAPSPSLLDDDDGAAALGSVLIPDRSPALAPVPIVPIKASASQGQGRKTKSLLDDDDEWNW